MTHRKTHRKTHRSMGENGVLITVLQFIVVTHNYTYNIMINVFRNIFQLYFIIMCRPISYSQEYKNKLEHFNFFSAGTVIIRQSLYKDGPHTERSNIFLMAVDP